MAAKFRNPSDASTSDISGLQGIDLSTGNITFRWDALSAKIAVDESLLPERRLRTNTASDFFHLNSVDKNSAGDYLVSGRHVSTVYKISGKDGSILWRLGGKKSDFTLSNGADFHYQHDARFRYENATHTIISLLDNAVAPNDQTNHDVQATSSGKMILLNTVTMTATLLRHFPRPHGLPSRKMGNLQTLNEDPVTSNVLINWASPGGISEFDSSNNLLLEASIAAGTVTSYRVFKHRFVGMSLYPPALKVLPAAMGPRGDAVSTRFYMSWNGATDVQSWKVYISAEHDDEETGPFALAAEMPKRGFETAWTFEGDHSGIAYVEAMGADGKSLGKSTMTYIPNLHERFSDREKGQDRQDEDEVGYTWNMQSALSWLTYACVLYGLYAAVHRLFVVYQPAPWRRNGYRLL